MRLKRVNKKMIEIKKRFLNNLDIKLLALVMAIALWFYISSEYNISAERYYDIEIMPINLSNNLSIKEIRNKVSVGIKGPQNILENISSQKILGTVDLESIKEAGEYQIMADAVVPRNTNIIRIIPSEVRVIVEEVLEKEFQVEYNLIGLPEKGYSLEDEPEISPKKVAIKGPESLLENIEKVTIDIDISSINKDYNGQENVVVYNKNNEQMNNLFVNPDIVLVTIKVDKGYPEKILPVKPRIIGKPAPQYYISKIEANPNHIRVYGNYSKIHGLEFLETIPIDVNGISKTLAVKIPPVIGEGIYLINEEETLIEVQIFLEEKVEEKIFENIIVKYKDASPFVDYKLTPETVDVRVSGKLDILEGLTNEDIEVFVNLSDIQIEYARVEVELPPAISLVQVTPEQLKISIKK